MLANKRARDASEAEGRDHEMKPQRLGLKWPQTYTEAGLKFNFWEDKEEARKSALLR